MTRKRTFEELSQNGPVSTTSTYKRWNATSPPEPPFVCPSVLLILPPAGTSSWLLAPSAGFACVCILYRWNLQDVLFWGCSVTPHYASGVHPCWTLQTFIIVVCPSSLLWRALWVCTAISVSPIDGCVAGPSWLLLNSCKHVCAVSWRHCMHFFWINSHPGVGILGHRIWVSATLIDRWHPTANLLIFFSHQ